MRSNDKTWGVPMGHSTRVALASCLFLVGIAWGDESSRPVGTISGTVVDERPNCSPENCARLAQCTSEEEAKEILREIVGGGPAEGATVTVTNDAITRETVTDAEGRYTFTDLPMGSYHVVAMKVDRHRGPIHGVGTDTECGKAAHLVIHDKRITVRGRIIDPDGRPIAGAEIIGTLVPMAETGRPKMRHAISDANGVYALKVLEPVGVYRVAGYLNGGSLDAPGSLHTQIEIRVEAEGFRQDRANAPRVPLIAERQLLDGLRLWEALAQLAITMGHGDSWTEPKIRLPYTTEKDAVTNVDIVLAPALSM